MKRTRRSVFNKLITFKFLGIFGLLIVVLLGINWWRLNAKDVSMKREIKKLETEVMKLEEENKRLVGLRDLFQTEFFIEDESRKSLGYAKPDERVIILEKTQDGMMGQEQDQPLSNPEKWMRYFFGN